jgi:hypothetical protein
MHVGGLHGHDGEPFSPKIYEILTVAWMVYLEVVLVVQVD